MPVSVVSSSGEAMRTTTVRRRTRVRIGEVADDIRISSGQATSPSRDILDYREEMIRAALRPNSITKAVEILTRCERAVGHRLLSSTPVELRDWLDGLKIVASTRYNYISQLAAFWKWAVTDDRVISDPTSKLTRPKLRSRLPRPVSATDLVILIRQAPTAELRAMIVLGGYVGLRCMEIAGLDAADILDDRTPPVLVVANGKGGKIRVIPVSPVVVEALRAHGARSYGPVFTDDNGKALQPWKISHLLRDHMQACGVVGSAHSLRHSFATEVYRRSGDILMTQNLLGHASPATTAGYAAWNQDGAAGVVATLFT